MEKLGGVLNLEEILSKDSAGQIPELIREFQVGTQAGKIKLIISPGISAWRVSATNGTANVFLPPERQVSEAEAMGILFSALGITRKLSGPQLGPWRDRQDQAIRSLRPIEKGFLA